MAPSSSRARRAAHAVKIAAGRAQSTSVVRTYVESFKRPDGKPDLRLREKVTRRIIRVLSDDPLMHQITPLATLMAECYAHGNGLTKPTGRDEHIAIAAPIVDQNSEEVCFWLDQNFGVTVRIQTAAVISPPTSVWCFIEKYSEEDGGPGLRLREKGTGRKVEMYGKTKDHLIAFLASPEATGSGHLLANLFEKDGYRDYVLVSGGTTVDTYDVIRYEDDSKLTYIIGPTTHTAYRDAFRIAEEETAATAHARTAATHLRDGRYREAVLSARLAIEAACGGRGRTVANRLADSPEASDAAMALNELRHTAVHGLDTRIEQRDAEESVLLMDQVLEYVLGSEFLGAR